MIDKIKIKIKKNLLLKIVTTRILYFMFNLIRAYQNL